MGKHLLREIKFVSDIIHHVFQRTATIQPLPHFNAIKFFSIPRTGWKVWLMTRLDGGQPEMHEQIITLPDFDHRTPEQIATEFVERAGLPVDVEPVVLTEVDAATELAAWIMQGALERLWIGQTQPLVSRCPYVTISPYLTERWDLWMSWQPIGKRKKLGVKKFSCLELSQMKQAGQPNWIAEQILTEWGVPQRSGLIDIPDLTPNPSQQQYLKLIPPA